MRVTVGAMRSGEGHASSPILVWDAPVNLSTVACSRLVIPLELLSNYGLAVFFAGRVHNIKLQFCRLSKINLMAIGYWLRLQPSMDGTGVPALQKLTVTWLPATMLIADSSPRAEPDDHTFSLQRHARLSIDTCFSYFVLRI